MTVLILHGDCLDHLDDLEEASVHAVVTDPPYHLTNKGGGPHGKGLGNAFARAQAGAKATGFMGKKWDGGDVAFDPATWRKVLRVMRPGAYLVAFGGTRTYHRLACAIEDAGFEIRDQLAWVYGSGFPKGTDKAKIPPGWEGWNTALKPAWEPIVLARKPMSGTLAANLEAHGCGALNIDGCRVPTTDEVRCTGDGFKSEKFGGQIGRGAATMAGEAWELPDAGRWPANLAHDGSDDVVQHFPDAPGKQADAKLDDGDRKTQNVYDAMKRGNGRNGEASAKRRYTNEGGTDFALLPGARRGDAGSAARFFYCAKASQAERGDGNHHPTVKPIALMRWLVRLLTPPGGTVLDLFMGSGSTGCATELEGFDFVGIEGEAEYVEIARQRIGAIAPLFHGGRMSAFPSGGARSGEKA